MSKNEIHDNAPCHDSENAGYKIPVYLYKRCTEIIYGEQEAEMYGGEHHAGISHAESKD